jgi:hypothetical protein
MCFSFPTSRNSPSSWITMRGVISSKTRSAHGRLQDQFLWPSAAQPPEVAVARGVAVCLSLQRTTSLFL